MEKRYQVFISSTRKDLEEERRILTDALLLNQFIPVGMEHFPASSDKAWPIIRRFIDECDFYVLVIAGMYGSINPENDLSYTESEYLYAAQAKKPLYAFVHKDISSLRSGMVEPTAKRRRQRDAFIARVEADLVRATWSDPSNLATAVTSALNRATRESSAVGWVRADSIPEQFGALHADLLDPCTRLGIGQVSIDGVAGSEMRENLARARTTRIMSTSAVRLLEIYKQSFIDSVRDGGRIQILLPDPEGTFLADVEESESAHGPRGVKISEEVAVVRQRLLEIVREVPNSGSGRPLSSFGTVEIGYFTTHLRSTLVLCDDHWGWLTLTLPPARAPETASLALNGGDRSLLNVCVRHFERTWEVVTSRGSTELLGP
ncbi:DUF4062 domain-containing protein [Streptomyces sp. MNU76]|uniref:DUF4062 domain-containing protein n=1 Tax=Streptomyces sp. MNU76 TaxID=2560026 RepID=UPI001E2DEE6C|nr:DUF4062 domain-containing protein [Streptomyces sp. MNU76]MCC9710333.1 DUF4062 domain-containing protein [Streptomyces sp. MNU76]